MRARDQLRRPTGTATASGPAASRWRRACGGRWRRGSGTRSPTCACTATRSARRRGEGARRAGVHGRARHRVRRRAVRARHAGRAGAARARADARGAAARAGRGRLAPGAEPRRTRAGRAVARGGRSRRRSAPGRRSRCQAEGEGDTREAAEATAGATSAAIRRDVRGGAAELHARPHRGRDVLDPPRRRGARQAQGGRAAAGADEDPRPRAPARRRARATTSRCWSAASPSSRRAWPPARTKAELLEARRELGDNRADLDVAQGRLLAGARARRSRRPTATRSPGLHCMGAAYAGLGALTSPEQSDEVKRQVAEKAEAGLDAQAPGEPRPVHHGDGHRQRGQDRRPQAARRWSRRQRALDADARDASCARA